MKRIQQTAIEVLGHVTPPGGWETYSTLRRRVAVYPDQLPSPLAAPLDRVFVAAFSRAIGNLEKKGIIEVEYFKAPCERRKWRWKIRLKPDAKGVG